MKIRFIPITEKTIQLIHLTTQLIYFVHSSFITFFFNRHVIILIIKCQWFGTILLHILRQQGTYLTIKMYKLSCSIHAGECSKLRFICYLITGKVAPWFFVFLICMKIFFQQNCDVINGSYVIRFHYYIKLFSIQYDHQTGTSYWNSTENMTFMWILSIN